MVGGDQEDEGGGLAGSAGASPPARRCFRRSQQVCHAATSSLHLAESYTNRARQAWMLHACGGEGGGRQRRPGETDTEGHTQNEEPLRTCALQPDTQKSGAFFAEDSCILLLPRTFSFGQQPHGPRCACFLPRPSLLSFP